MKLFQEILVNNDRVRAVNPPLAERILEPMNIRGNMNVGFHRRRIQRFHPPNGFYNRFMNHFDENMEDDFFPVMPEAKKATEQPKGDPIISTSLVETINFQGFFIEYIVPAKQICDLLDKAKKIDSSLPYYGISGYLSQIIAGGNIFEQSLNEILYFSKSNSNPSPSFVDDCLNLLSSMFPLKTRTGVRQSLNIHKGDIMQTIQDISTNPDIPQLKKGRAIVKNIKCSDPLLCYQFKKINDEKKAVEDKKKQEEEEIRFFEEAKIKGALIECGCCCNDVPIVRCVQCPEGHLCCRDCIKRMIETSIAEGRTTVKCASMGNCEHMIPWSELERTMPDHLLKRLTQTEVLNDLAQCNISNLVKCYYCGNTVEFIGDGSFKCPECQHQTCTKCLGENHPGISCDDAKKIRGNSIEEKMNESIVRHCPKCNTPFTKDEGCNKMVCPRCKTIICYWCQKVIDPKVGYSHFFQGNGPCPPGQCPLWVDNKLLNSIEEQKAKLIKETDSF